MTRSTDLAGHGRTRRLPGGRARRRGSALVYSFIMLTVVTAVSFTALSYARTATRVSGTQLARARLRGLAECGIADAVHNVWDKYLASQQAHTAGTATQYAAWLDGVGWRAGGPYTLASTTSSLDRQRSKLTLSLFRKDVLNAQNVATSVILTVVASASTAAGDTSVTLTGTYKVGAAPWPGLRFGLLTNNVNCIICHATFDNAARVFNRDATKYGTFERARVASLSELNVRTLEDTATTIRGTLYTFGSIYSSETGVPVTPGTGTDQLSGSMPDVQFDKIDSSGNIVESSTGATSPVSPYAKDSQTLGPPAPPFGNLYIDYPSNTANQVDGDVPSSFPSIVPDTDGNRLVGDAEWTAAAANATGTLTAANFTTVPFGGSTSATTLPGSSGGPVTFGSSSGGSIDKSVVLVGTASNPITVNGTVAFGGDVILSGVVQGTGEILARGNLYIVGDLTYNDGKDSSGNRTFGVQSSGDPNAIAYAAGGNVMIGNWIDDWKGNPYYNSNVTAGGVTTDMDTQLHMSFAEIATFNRDEWAKTQPYLPAVTPKPVKNSRGQVTGYQALPAPVPSGPGANIYPASGYVWATNPSYAPGYTPRFYTQDDGQVYVAADLPPAQAGANPAQATSYSGRSQPAQAAGTQGMSGYVYDPTLGGWKSENDGSGSNPGSTLTADIPIPGWTSILAPAYVKGTTALDGSTPAPSAPALLSLSPGTYGGKQWIGESTLRSLTSSAMSARAKKPLEIDGLVYTNNSIFSIAKTGDSTGGQLTVNGSLIAADTGILAPNGLQCNYDVNTRTYINVSDPTHVALMTGALTER